MKHFLGLLIVAASLTMPLCAHADTLTTFYITDGTFESGGTLSGSFVLDTTADYILSATINVNADGLNLQTSDFTVHSVNAGPFIVSELSANTYQSLGLLFSPSTSPHLCTVQDTSSCPFASVLANNGPQPGSDRVVSATISTQPAAVTPEPCSLVLLGTGALGMAGAVRRRFVRS